MFQPAQRYAGEEVTAMRRTVDEELMGQPLEERVSGRMEKIEDLKEALKHVRDMKDEMTLLEDLSREISALRRLREPYY
jgi:hypothetical protein